MADAQFVSGLSLPAAPPISLPQAATAVAGAGDGGNSNVVPFPQQSGRGGIRQAVAAEWKAAGYPDAAVQGIMRRIGVESGWDPHAVGDYNDAGQPTSFDLYQHHGERAARMLEWTRQHGLNPGDPVAQTKYAIAELNGLDPIAAQHRDELMRVTDPNVGYGVFTRSFERPAGAPGSEETNLHSVATGAFQGPAAAVFQRWQSDLAARGKRLDAAIAKAGDIDTAAHAALQKWAAESDKPPQNMHEAWHQWVGVASAFALLGGLFGRNHTAAIAAAGGMLQAANAADAQAYDRNYKLWKDHSENGLKLIELLNREARNIVDDARKSYDEKLSELSTLSAAYSLSERLNPESVENITKRLELEKMQRSLIEAQNHDTEIRNAVKERDAEWLKAHPEAGGTVPANIHLQHEGEAKREISGTITRPTQPHEIEITDKDGHVVQRVAAYQDSTGAWLQVGTNAPIAVPAGGAVNLKSTQQPRSAPAMAVQKYMEEHPSASADEISHFNALFRADAAFAAGPEGRNVTALNTLADHLPLFERYARALQTGNLQTINAALQRLQEETGHPEITNFNIARDFVADEAVRVMVPGGSAGALADREAMKRDLLARMSEAQFAGAADVIKDFTHGKLAALRQQYSRGDKSKADYFDSRILTPGAKRLFDTGHEPAAPAAASVPVPAEHRSDPDGKRYQGSDGRVYVKHGEQMVPEQ